MTVDNNGDEKSPDEIEKEKEERLNKAYYSTFHSMEGQLVLQDLLNVFYRRPLFDEDVDSNKIILNEGKRFVALYILGRMEVVSNRREE